MGGGWTTGWRLSAAGRDLDPRQLPPFEMKLEIEATGKRRRKARTGKARKREKAAPPAKAGPPANAGVEKALRDWRLAEAKRREVPAFRILSDKSLQAIATEKPLSIREIAGNPRDRTPRLCKCASEHETFFQWGPHWGRIYWPSLRQ